MLEAMDKVGVFGGCVFSNHPIEENIIKKVRFAAKSNIAAFKLICEDYFVYDEPCMSLLREIAKLGIVEPMAATVFSVIFLDEKLRLLPEIGIALILAAVFMLGKAEGPQKAKKDTGGATNKKEAETNELH